MVGGGAQAATSTPRSIKKPSTLKIGRGGNPPPQSCITSEDTNDVIQIWYQVDK
jgi:hypothetical protein